jgi:flagellar L-ring protein precursor FlgH
MRLILALATATSILAAAENGAQGNLSPIDAYIQEATEPGRAGGSSPGSLYAPSGLLGNLGRDLRAAHVGDIVTVVVSDRASAVSSGTANSSRSSSASSSVLSLLGPLPAGGNLANLATLGGERQLQGQGQTSRTTVLTTTLSVRVTHALPNGNLVVEGTKETWINAERQRVSIRGIVRWNDLDGSNRVSSDRLSDLEVRVDGKGVVGDAIHRPNFLYRVLLGLLPF